MYARIAQFELEPGSVDDMLGGIRESMSRGREQLARGEVWEEMAGLEDVKRVMVLVDRDSGQSVSLVLCDTEDGLRKADEALNRMSPQGGGRRTSVGLYEVAIDESPRG